MLRLLRLWLAMTCKAKVSLRGTIATKQSKFGGQMKKLIFLFLTILLISGNAYSKDERSVTVKAKKGADTGVSFNAKYHALIIGSNNYKYLPKLKTAIADAKAVEEILRTQYGFTTKLLIDATREDILNGMNDLRKGLGEKDNLLIYYAGHGEFEKTADKSYWIPVNAERDNPTNWISADDITSNIKRITSKHILIVSDSCYSGTLTRAVSGDLTKSGERDEFIKKMMEKPSRTLMASGGNEPVADSGGGNHSVFASAFLKALRETEKNVFTAEELFHGRGSVKEVVAGKSDQVPEYNTIKNSGHDGGDFVFQLASLSSAKEDVTLSLSKGQKGSPSPEVSEEMKMLQEEKERLKSERQDLEQKKALMEEKKLLEEERQKLEKEKSKIVAMADVGDTGSSSYKDPVTGMEFVSVQGGCYQMGDTFGDGESNEKPVHEVCVDDLYMGKYEVTQAQWQKVMGNNPSYFKNCDNCPVENVSWNDNQSFITTLTVRTGKGYRLPTEAEWEYAARSGGKKEKFAGGNALDSVAWYGNNSGSKTHAVGQKNPNGLGIYDMSGNVWEWMQDWYGNGYYASSPKNNPKGPDSGSVRVLRGGSGVSSPKDLRAAYRGWDGPGVRGTGSGFRLVVSSVRQ